jgi:hypothetical protein
MAAAFSSTAQLQEPSRWVGWRRASWILGSVAAGLAAVVAAVLAVVFAVAVAAIALIGGALLALGGFAFRARKAARAPGADHDIIEARRVGGHSWVAYGWDQRG